MGFIERILDKITPRLEVVDEFELAIEGSSNRDYVLSVVKVLQYKIIELKEDEITLLVEGRTVGEADFSGFLGKDPDSKKLNKLKSKLEVSFGEKSVRLTSYEHIIATKKEKEIFRAILSRRLELLKDKLIYGATESVD